MTAAWIDISQPLQNGHAEWPGDTPFSYELAYSKADTGSVNIGKLTMSTHMGTHIDAPFHFADEGATVESLPLETYIGTTLVIDLQGVETITRKEIEKIDFQHHTRVLFKTTTQRNLHVFPEQYVTFQEDAAQALKERGVRLIGIDAPSVDPETSKALLAHHAFHAHEIAILENIVLDHVAEGAYELIALPLHIVGADGSPVRAVIRPL